MRTLLRTSALFNFRPVASRMPRKNKPCPLCSPDFIPTARFDDARALAVNAVECLVRDAKEAAERHNDYVERSVAIATAWRGMSTMLGEGDLEALDDLLGDVRKKLVEYQKIKYDQELNHDQRRPAKPRPAAQDQDTGAEVEGV